MEKEEKLRIKQTHKTKKQYQKPLAKMTNISLGVWGGTNCGSCLTPSTKIATPFGTKAVRHIKAGDIIYTLNRNHRRITVPVLKISKTEVSKTHYMIHLTMTDGRHLFASPDHPLAESRKIRQLNIGEKYDNSSIKSIELKKYQNTYTYDILPKGDTGFYWADDILIGSTLFPQEDYPIAEIFSQVQYI